MNLFDITGFDAFVSALQGVSLVDQWESRVAKVGGKVFALLSKEGGRPAHVIFKCGEDSFEILTAINGITQARYFAKRQWVAVESGADLPGYELEAYVVRSYELIARSLTKKARQELGITLAPMP